MTYKVYRASINAGVLGGYQMTVEDAVTQINDNLEEIVSVNTVGDYSSTLIIIVRTDTVKSNMARRVKDNLSYKGINITEETKKKLDLINKTLDEQNK